MNETDIRKYAGMLQEFGLTGIEITEGNKSVRLERAVSGVAARETVILDNTASPVVSTAEEDTDYISVKSPVVGVSEICVANDQVVEFGTELFRMKR